MKCASCGGRVRKGTGRRAMVLSRDGMVPGTVCAKCASTGVLIVTPPPVQVPPPCPCGQELAKYGEGCVERLGQNVRELSGANAALAARST